MGQCCTKTETEDLWDDVPVVKIVAKNVCKCGKPTDKIIQLELRSHPQTYIEKYYCKECGNVW
jgi:hypothetical protein